MNARMVICRWLSIALLSSSALPARAQAEAPLPPWHDGVSEERKQRALALFTEGRELHRRMILGDARKKYEEALALWEHPDLRFYLGRVLRTIGMPLSAYENLQLSLQWGPASLEKEDYAEAQRLMNELMAHELAVIEMRCDEPGAVVQLDGKRWFVGPGSGSRIVMPGEHVVSTSKVGHFPLVKSVVVLAGTKTSGVLTMSVDRVITERRWASWTPWAVAGAGVVLGGAGALFQWQSAKHIEEANELFKQTCKKTCSPMGENLQSRGETEGGVAVGLFIAGGAALATGSVLTFLNRPRSYRSEDRSGVDLQVVPAASDAVAGLSARLSF